MGRKLGPSLHSCCRWSHLQRARKGIEDGDDAKANFRRQVTEALATLSQERASHKEKEEEMNTPKSLRFSSGLRGKSKAVKTSGKQTTSFELLSLHMKEGVITKLCMMEMMWEEKTLKSLLTSVEMWPPRDKETVKMLERYLTLRREREKLPAANDKEVEIQQWFKEKLDKSNKDREKGQHCT